MYLVTRMFYLYMCFCWLVVIIYSSMVNVLALPVITSSTHSIVNGTITVAKGSKLVLRCEATGNEELEYRWKKVPGGSTDNANVGRRQSLTISNAMVNNGGEYHCLAGIKGMRKRNASMNVQVIIATLPIITVHPEDIVVAEGSNITLTCKAIGYGTLNYQWKKESDSLPKNFISNGGPNLTLHNITVNDSGQYYCEIENEEGNVTSERAEVTVRRPPKITNNPSDKQLIIVRDNEQVTLTCEFTGDNITGAYWERVNNGLVNNNISSLSNDKRTLTITITGAHPTHSGSYRCVVYSQWGVAQSRNVQVTITIAPPMIAAQPTSVIIAALQDVTFTFKAIGFEVKYEWKRHNGSVTGGRQSNLTISRATPLDEDQYYCVAMTKGGYAFSNNATLTVNDYIIISQHPQRVTLATGNMLSLNVIANGPGNNRFNYQWKRRGSTSLPDRANGERNSNLEIRSVSPSDSGSYYCVVMNQWGNMMESKDATVTVWPPPVIKVHPKDITIPEGSNVMLTCEAMGDGTLNYQWRRASGSLQRNSGRQTLTIQNIAVDDSGQYYCEVDNGGDKVTSKRAQVTVRRVPKITNNPSNKQLSIVRDNEQVTLTCRVTGDDITGGYWERVNDDPLPVNNNMSSLSNDKRTPTITIKNIRPIHSGTYRCVVYSQWGVAQSRDVRVTIIIAPPMITRQPTYKNITALQDVTFTCEAKGFMVLYEWKRHNGRVTGGRQSNLTISGATPLDEDQYYCVAMTEGGYVFSNNATLIVNDMLSVQATPASRTIGERGTAEFVATASGINMINFMYQWRKRGSDSLPYKVSGVNEAILTIPNLIVSDEGQYYCVVTNEWGRSVESDDARLTVKAGLPLFPRHPQDQVVNNRQTATFECFVNGSDSSLTVIWERNKKQYNSGNLENTVYSNGVRSILTINVITLSDDGKYRCNATNVDGKSATSNEADLIIIPEIRNNPKNVTELIGQSTQLNCRAIGTDIFYQWTKNSIPIPDATSRILRITNITDSDEGVYKCVASNKGGRVESNPANITAYGPPMIEKLPLQLHAVLGKEFNITCTATNDHDAPMNMTLSWIAPSGVDIITTNKHGGFTTTSTFHISDVTHNHNGTYQCTASNGEHQENNISTISTLVVEEKSSPPINFKIININATSFQIMWSPPTNPHGEIYYYTVYYNNYTNSSHNQFVQIVENTNFDGTYILTNLRPYTEYSVYMTAVRLIGDTNRPLEGISSLMLTARTFAGEPIITDSEVNQIMSQIILNINNSATSTGNTFDIDLPQISVRNGPFSHLYIIVIINNSAINATVLSTQELLNHSMDNLMLLYIAAVVNASQYMQYANDYRIRYALGAGDNTTDINGRMFHNREVKREYSFFYRVFSVNSTIENEIYTDTEIKPVATPQQSTGGGSSSSGSAIGPIIGVIVALLLIIAVIVVVILLLFCYKKKHLEPKKVGLSDVVPTDVPLSNKEMKDEEAKLLAATNPFPQETSFSPNSPLPIEVTTSVGQPTTLFIELPYADDSEITWQKDGKSVNHPVLPDGSLYIANTKLTDQGDYTVTAAATDSITSESLKLLVIDPKIPTTLSNHKPVKVEDFPEHIALMQSKKSIQFEEDYESVMVDVATSQHAAKLHVNASKNRYKNIIPYDHCRVVLTQQGEKPGSDYVNASFVDGYKEPKAYIASQGPVSNTVDDFWRMIWECNVTTIVMLTRLVEDSKIKCHQYWPENEFAEHGDFKVTIIKHEVIAKYCIRQFVIEKTSDHKSREVCQFHYTAWPDHGVPKYGIDILEFQKRINKYHKRKDNKPMLVHCSAGVGRTGTFIAIDTEIQRINNESLVDAFNCVCRLRFWRNHMVQTVDQYTLIFTALLEYIACGDTSIAAPTKSVQDKVRELSTVDPNTKKTGFETQFETLTKNSPKEKEFSFSFATSSKNKNKNRNKKSMPPDASRVHLSKAGSKSDYINACYIDGYRHCKEFLVGPGPMESTSADFWRMIWENQSHAIVMLGQLKENGEEASCQYWPKKDDKCEFDNLTVSTTSEDPMDNNVMKRVMKITHKETSATKTITQLQYVEWSQNVTPSTATSIIDLIETLERIQRKTGNGPVTVHCSDGMGRSGTFCALVVSINRFKAEQMVDVFKTIITMRTQRPGLVANAEQYKFIHEAITTMLQRFVNYSNFSFDDMTASAVYENLPTSST